MIKQGKKRTYKKRTHRKYKHVGVTKSLTGDSVYVKCEYYDSIGYSTGSPKALFTTSGATFRNFSDMLASSTTFINTSVLFGRFKVYGVGVTFYPTCTDTTAQINMVGAYPVFASNVVPHRKSYDGSVDVPSADSNMTVNTRKPESVYKYYKAPHNFVVDASKYSIGTWIECGNYSTLDGEVCLGNLYPFTTPTGTCTVANVKIVLYVTLGNRLK